MFKEVRSDIRVPISEAHPDFENKASPDQLRAVEIAKRTSTKSSEQVAKELGLKPEIKAKYKIEVRFMKDRTTLGPNLCGIQIWESGKRLHGGGDDKMFFCKDVRPQSQEGCWGPISSDFIKGGTAYCQRCKAIVNVKYLTDIRIFRLPTKTLASQIEKIFRSLDSNADIYLKYDRRDVHYQAMERYHGHEVARRLRGLHIYPLQNIIKDSGSEADLTHRIFVFLTS